uniref:Predicted nucleic acid-binding protein, contains PIN domain n=1 Tax=Candidatus Kentrum sp. FW TaxID=2126338 RepID=A0A450TX27_9GAMM|nr:MAG: Predicted nucleic acid-binding protein, contains PIN domain [Candidatus Kentron sp. FW]
MNVVDSSGWLEYFAGGRNAAHFAAPLKASKTLVVPVISIYEVFKVILREAGEDAALEAAMAMQRAQVIADLTPRLAMSAALLSIEHSLPMADSIILASARAYKATIWTQDVDFKDMDNVKYFPKG